MRTPRVLIPRLLEVSARTASRATRADARDEVRHSTVGITPDLGTGLLIVAQGAVLVRVLVGFERTGNLPGEAIRRAAIRHRVVVSNFGWRNQDRCAVCRERVAFVLPDLVGNHENAPIPTLLPHQRKGDARVAARRFNNCATRARAPLFSAASSIRVTIRSFDDAPGFIYSTFASTVAAMPSVTRFSLTRGVSPTRSMTPSTYFTMNLFSRIGCAALGNMERHDERINRAERHDSR